MQSSRKQRVAYGVVFIILIGFLIFAMLSSRDSKTTPQSGTSKIRGTASENEPRTLDQNPSTPAESTPPTSAPAPSPSPSAAAATNNQQLVNSGPGETVTLFAATVLAGTAVAHVHQRRTTVK